MRTRRATSLLFAAAASCAVLSPRTAAEPTVTAPTGALRAGSANTPINSEPGRRLKTDLLTHEQKVIDHLTGVKSSSFGELRVRQDQLQTTLEQAGELPAEERKALTEDLHRIGQLLFVTEPLAVDPKTGLPTKRLPPAMEKLLREAGRKTDRVDALTLVTDQIRTAAAHPESAGTVFDNLRQGLGSGDDTKNAIAAVLADVRAKDPIPYTPVDRSRFHLGRAVPQPAPGPTPLPKRTRATPVASVDVAAAANAALRPFALQTDAGKEWQFRRDRQDQQSKLQALAEAAERALGRPTGSLDEMVADLVKQEAAAAAALGLGPSPDPEKPGFLDAMKARLLRLQGAGKQDLAMFTGALWQYRDFLRGAIEGAAAPTGTHFKPWETFPRGAGYSGITVAGYTQDGADFVGLRYEKAGKEFAFQAFTPDGAHAIKVVSDRLGKIQIVRQDFDGALPRTQLVTDLDAAGHVVVRESYDFKTKEVRRVLFSPDGKVLRTETGNPTAGTGTIEQRGPGVHYNATITPTERRVEFVDDHSPFKLVVENLGPDGFELNFRIDQRGVKEQKKTKHVNEFSKDGKVQRWQADVSGLAGASAKDRPGAASALAGEILAAVGESDSYRKSLASFLANEAVMHDGMGEYNGQPPLMFSISPGSPKTFTLILQNTNGTRSELTGTLGQSTAEPGNRGREPAFLVQTKVDLDKNWSMIFPAEILPLPGDTPERAKAKAEAVAAAQKRATRIAYEYLGDGTRVWRHEPTEEMKGKYEPGFFGSIGNYFSDQVRVTHRVFQRQRYDSATNDWTSDKDHVWDDPHFKEVPGSSGAMALAGSIVSTPGIKQVFAVSNGVSTAITTHLIEPGFGAATSDPDLAELNQFASNVRETVWCYRVAGSQPDGQKDPAAMNEWIHKLLKELKRPGAWKLLDAKVLEMRPERLALMGLDKDDSPAAYDQALHAAPTDIERFFTLPEFGWGTHGKQMSARGGVWNQIGGTLLSGLETATDIATNPLTYLLPYAFSGLGKVAEFATSRIAAISAEGGSTMALRGFQVLKWGAKGTKVLLEGTVALPFLAATGHEFTVAAQKFGTPEGNQALGHSLVNAAFIYGMGREMMKGRLGDKLTDALTQKSDPVKPETPKPGTPEPTPLPQQLTFDFMKEPVHDTPVKPNPVPLGDPVVDPVPAHGPEQLVFDFVKDPVKVDAAVDPAPRKAPEPPHSHSPRQLSLDFGGDVLNDRAGLPKGDVALPDNAGRPVRATTNPGNGPIGSAEAPAAKTVPHTDVAVAESPARGTNAALDPAAHGPSDLAAAAERTGKTKEGTPEHASDPAIEFKSLGETGRSAETRAPETAPRRGSPGEQLEFDFMKDLPQNKTVLLEEVKPAEGPQRQNLAAKDLAGPREPLEANDPSPHDDTRTEGERVPEKETLGRKLRRGAKEFGRRVMEGGHYALSASLLPKMPPTPGRRAPALADTGDPDSPPSSTRENPNRNTNTNTNEDETVVPPQDGDNNNDSTTLNNNNSTANNNNNPNGRDRGYAGGQNGGAPGASGGPGGDRHPSVKSPGGFGGGKGGGGGAGGGGGGGGGNPGDGPQRGGGSSPPAADIGAAVPAGARPAAFAPVPVKAPKSAATGNGFGGHSPEPSLASRFDGSKDRARTASDWAPTPMKGLGAGGDGGLPKLGGARADAAKAPAAKDAALTDATAASATPGVQPAGAPVAARAEDEDYGYTYLAPAKHKYELPTDHPGPGDDWRYLIDLALRASAVLAVIYLASHSDLPYLIGFTRRRRKND